MPDRLVVELMHALLEKFDNGNYTYRVSGNLRIDTEEFEALPDLATQFSLVEAIFSSSQEDISATFKRGISGKDFTDRQPSAHFDEIAIERIGKTGPSPINFIEAEKIIQRIADPLHNISSPSIPEDISDFLKANYAQLTSLITEIASRYDERLAELERRRQQLEDEQATKIECIDAEYQKRKEELEREREQLSREKKALDDRDNVHVRRELREKITRNLKERLKEPLVSRANTGVRYAVVTICGFASIALFALAFFTQQQFGTTSDSIEKWSIVIKAILSGAGGAGFLIYAISWLRRVYLDDVQLERSLERYALDIDRASWAIETLIEMSKIEGAQVPSAWVQGVCNDLFSSSASKEDTTGLQALAALMDVAAGAEVGTEGTKLTLNRRGARKLAQQGDQ
jgi:hypothetical protein